MKLLKQHSITHRSTGRNVTTPSGSSTFVKKLNLDSKNKSSLRYITFWTFDGYVPVIQPPRTSTDGACGDTEIVRAADVRVVLILEDKGLCQPSSNNGTGIGESRIGDMIITPQEIIANGTRDG